VKARLKAWQNRGDWMRQPLAAVLAMPLLLMGPLAWHQGDIVRMVSPETTSAREELERMQKQNGLTISFVDYQGIGVLDFKKKAFAFRTLGFKGNGIAGAVSRDASTVALFGTLSNPGSLLIVRPGADVVREYPEVVGSPACWSYENSRLLLMRSGPELQIMDLASKAIQTLTIVDVSNEGPINAQCWSPDGQQIAYGTSAGSVSVYDLEEGKSTNLAKGADPTWSPDGKWIAYRDRETYYAIRPSGEDRKKLFHKTRAVSPLYWSPDSRFVAYIHQDFFALDVEFYHLMVRRLADGEEDSMGGAGSGYNYQWVQNPQLIKWVESGERKH